MCLSVLTDTDTDTDIATDTDTGTGTGTDTQTHRHIDAKTHKTHRHTNKRRHGNTAIQTQSHRAAKTQHKETRHTDT